MNIYTFGLLFQLNKDRINNFQTVSFFSFSCLFEEVIKQIFKNKFIHKLDERIYKNSYTVFKTL
jgi:hypothetical protein